MAITPHERSRATGPAEDAQELPDRAQTPVAAAGTVGDLLIRRIPLILLIGIVAGAVAYALSGTRAESYQSTAKILLSRDDSVAGLLDPGARRASSDPERELNTDVALITTDAVAEAVRARIGARESADDLAANVRASLEGTSQIVAIVAEAPRPEAAAELANGFATEFIAYLGANQRESLTRAITRARTRLRGIDAERRRGGLERTERTDLRRERAAVASQLRELESAQVLLAPRASLIAEADRPDEPTSPNPPRDAIVGFVLGLVLGVVLILGVRGMRDRRRVA